MIAFLIQILSFRGNVPILYEERAASNDHRCAYALMRGAYEGWLSYTIAASPLTRFARGMFGLYASRIVDSHPAGRFAH